MDPVLAHVGHVGAPTAWAFTLVSFLAGLLATAVMNFPMHRVREGTAPPFVAAGLLTDQPVSDVSSGTAMSVHYGAGMLAGGLFAAFNVVLGDLLPADPFLPGTQLSLAPYVGAGALLLAFLYVVFAFLVLPRATDWDAGKRRRVRNAWATSVTVYALALLVLVPLLTVALI